MINERLAEHASQLDLGFFDNPTFHNRLTNASNEASYRPVTILQSLLSMGASSITVGWMLVLLVQWHWWLVVAVMVVAYLRYYLATRQGKARVRLTLAQTPLQRTADYVKTVLTSDLFAKEVRLFQLGNVLQMRYHRLVEVLYRQQRERESRLLAVSLLAEPLLSVSGPVMMGYALVQALQRLISVEQYSVYTQALGQLSSGMVSIMTQGAQVHENILFFSNLSAFLAVVPEVERPRSPVTGELGPGSQDPLRVPRIDFCDVSFVYPGASKPTLDHLTLHIHPGEIVALVGANGAGKTTVIKLLAGLYEPTRGQILFDGVDITTLDRRRLRAYLSVIFQDYAIYHWSAADNIGVGAIEAMEDRARIGRAAEQSGFASVVQQFPEGYESLLGRWFERGQELSGGQRQLLALARALIKGASVLILDEPGAALDVENEQAFFERLLATHRLPQQTILFISHRYSTVRRADRILLLEDGRLLEEGSHHELMQRDGRYAHLFARQMHLYADETPSLATTAPTPSVAPQRPSDQLRKVVLKKP